MITVQDVELRAGARLLLEHVTFRVQPGDRIGLVGRNGAGKTTLTKTLAKQTLPAAGTITHSAPVGYLPQDPRTGDLDVLARDRVLSARGLDELMRGIEKAQVQLAERPDETLWAEQLELRFPGRVLPADAAVARAWGALAATGAADPLAGLTAATALVHGLTVLTAEPGRYAGTGAPVLDASPARR